jgi:ribonuclease-3
MMKELRQLEQKLGIRFRKPDLLRQAFTHASYVNEQKGRHRDNERLEFLGDAVLELVVSEFLYTRYCGHSEGELTRMRAALVCEPSLMKHAEALEFGTYVLLGKGEELTGGRSRPALLADVFEAFIGALYLDQGLPAVKQFLQRTLFTDVEQVDKPPFTDYKTQLQELVQQQEMADLEYRIVDERGPAHDREFVAEVRVNGESFGRGTGRTKKEAEQRAAAEALSRMGDMTGHGAN